MSTLIRSTGVAENAFVAIADEDPLPAHGGVLVSHARWLQDATLLKQRGQPFGLALPNTTDVEQLAPSALDAVLLVLEFPAFGDGRAYSQARLLREARGYRGELRATGAAVVRDQLQGMRRSGFDSYQLRADQSVPDCLQALEPFSIAYQPARDTVPRVRELRQKISER